jgi:glycosyltransferase involved in cell wall biosynthesis
MPPPTQPTSRTTVMIASRCARTIYAQRRALAEHIKSAGWRVILVGEASESDPYAMRLKSLGFEFQSVSVNQKSKSPLSFFFLLIDYIRLFRKFRPDVFHGFTVKPVIIGLIAAHVSKVPVRVCTIAGAGHLFLSGSTFLKSVAIILYRISLKSAHKIIFYNPDDQEMFATYRLHSNCQTLLIPGSGVDTKRFTPSTDLSNLKREPFKVLFIGRLLKEKGIEDLIEAARLLRNKNMRVIVQCLGSIDSNNPSSLSHDILTECKKKALVDFLGTSPDVRPFIAACDAVVLPSYREGIPLSLLEAGAMAKPMIATDVPGCRDVIINNETGILVPVRNPTMLADAISTLANDRGIARAMGKAARIDIEKRFSGSVINEKVLNVYRSLLHCTPEVIYNPNSTVNQ